MKFRTNVSVLDQYSSSNISKIAFFLLGIILLSVSSKVSIPFYPVPMTLLIYYLATKNPWKVKKKLPKSFFLTLLSFFIFVVISKTLDFFLAISVLSIFVSYYWGEKRIFYLLLVGIIFPVIVFIFFETILGLRFPPGIITNIYYS